MSFAGIPQLNHLFRKFKSKLASLIDSLNESHSSSHIRLISTKHYSKIQRTHTSTLQYKNNIERNLVLFEHAFADIIQKILQHLEHWGKARHPRIAPLSEICAYALCSFVPYQENNFDQTEESFFEECLPCHFRGFTLLRYINWLIMDKIVHASSTSSSVY